MRPHAKHCTLLFLSACLAFTPACLNTAKLFGTGGSGNGPGFGGLVSATGASDSKIQLKWDPGTGAVKYNIYDANTLTLIDSVDQIQYLVTGLQPSKNYNFVVRAEDASGAEEKNVVKKA